MTARIDRLNAVLTGRYHILEQVGEGGMATVYLADDLKHDRQVAIKVLKPELAAVIGGDRFLAEIKVTANLQHPHILPLYDSGEADSFLYYVMPYVQGSTLADRLAAERQLPVEEAIQVTTAVAQALDFAHRQGVVHRDIKPGNILFQDDQPVVSDFGIALAVGAGSGARLTETGLSVGTPFYMSPEQATGDQQVGAATDIFSLGCVFYETLTGDPPYQGSTAQAVLGKIIQGHTVSATATRKTVPAHVDATVRRALEKLPADRFASGGELARALADPGFRHGEAAASAGGRSAWNRLTVVLAAVAVLGVAGTVSSWIQPPEPAPVRRYQMVLPEGEEVGGWFQRVALSPDGSRLAYIQENEEGEREIWVRPRDDLHATPLPGTEGAEAPFFSFDGRKIGFFSPRGTLQVVSLDGGSPRRVTDTLVGAVGGTWGEDGTIYADGRGRTGLVRIPPGGRGPEYFTSLDSADGEIEHILPQALPGNRGVLFIIKYHDLTRSGIAVADPATGAHRVIETGRVARYLMPGYLVYGEFPGTGRLLVQSFDIRTLTLKGPAVTVAEGVAAGSVGTPDFSQDLAVASDGTVIYLAGTGGSGSTQIGWVERDGTYRTIDPSWTDQVEQGVALSPDGTRLALDTGGKIWVRQLESGAMTKLTFEGGLRPHWTPDGSEVVFISDRTGFRQAYARNADGTGSARLLVEDTRQVHEIMYSPDGRWLIYRVGGAGVGDLYARPVEGGDSIPLVETLPQENHASVSPDGRWLAYTSMESGRSEVWVRPFPNTSDGSWQVSDAGGTEPRWAPRGGELFFRSGNGDLVTVEVADGPTFLPSRPHTLFPADEYDSFVFNPMYSPSPDGQRFVMARKIREAGPLQPVVLENLPEWLEERGGR